MIRISVDVMGGDFGPEVVIPGAAKALERHPDFTFLLFGQQERCLPILAQFPKLKEKSTFHHCDVSVGMDEKPSQALRHGRWKSSMWKAIEAVKSGDPRAQLLLGRHYLEGTGVQKDDAEAVRWFRQAVGQNDARAKVWLGLCYESGHGVEQSLTQALRLWQEAVAANADLVR